MAELFSRRASLGRADGMMKMRMKVGMSEARVVRMGKSVHFL